MGISQDPLDDDAPIVPSDSDSDKPSPIGVPKDYSVSRQFSGREEAGDIRFRRPPSSYNADVTPTYFDGDEYIPANYPTTAIWQLQQALARVGLLRGSFTRGNWDPTTRNAYKELLALANAQGTDVNRAMQDLLSTSSSGDDSNRFTVDDQGNIVPAGGEPLRAPLVTQTSDPAALRRTFRRAVIEMLGEGWSTDKINQMVAAYNGVEVASQTQLYNMEGAGVAGSIQAPPSPEEFIASQVEAQDPTGVQSNEMLGFTQEFMDLASAPAWGVS